jgi:hypothetical protein
MPTSAGLGDQLTVGVDLALNLVGLADPLHPRHFLDLVAHRLAVLEQHGDLVSHGHPAVQLVLEDPRPVLLTHHLVAVELQNVAECEAAHPPSPSPPRP